MRQRWTMLDVIMTPLLLLGIIVLAVWWFGIQIATALKPCDKEPAKRRPRRAF